MPLWIRCDKSVWWCVCLQNVMERERSRVSGYEGSVSGSVTEKLARRGGLLGGPIGGRTARHELGRNQRREYVMRLCVSLSHSLSALGVCGVGGGSARREAITLEHLSRAPLNACACMQPVGEVAGNRGGQGCQGVWFRGWGMLHVARLAVLLPPSPPLGPAHLIPTRLLYPTFLSVRLCLVARGASICQRVTLLLLSVALLHRSNMNVLACRGAHRITEGPSTSPIQLQCKSPPAHLNEIARKKWAGRSGTHVRDI